MEKSNPRRQVLTQLLAKGVHMPAPETVEIAPDVNPEKISGHGVTIHAGSRISGAETLIMAGVELGDETPVTVHNCQLGRNVRLSGGFFYESCFLDAASVSSGAQVREACLLEEGARAAHTVGLKHTILFPFVTLGSLINFCDCLMAGGTDQRNHSEVGSSYIHFNYTPNQDKATPSLIGDVPEGVMLNQPPIFLGGQGGLVGPVQIAYGTVVSAGTIVRKDQPVKNSILLGHRTLAKTLPFHKGLYGNIRRIIKLNSLYISNLIALRRWYLDVRSSFVGNEAMASALLMGAIGKLEKAIEERLKRLGEVAGRMPESMALFRKLSSDQSISGILRDQEEFHNRWPDMAQVFTESAALKGAPAQKDPFLSVVAEGITREGRSYLRVIKGLSDAESRLGTAWLKGLIAEIMKRIGEALPGIRIQA